MRASADRLTCYLALLLAGLVAAVSISHGGFAAFGTDSSGYISAGDLWRDGAIVRSRALPLWAAWPNALESATPFGYRAGAISGTEVSTYPPGFPLLVAAAVRLAGPLGGYLVAPVFGSLLTWCAFLLARKVGGNLAGIIAAALVATSPITLLHTVHPASDVPAAACWTLAWLMALGGTPLASVAAGLAAGIAILVRPNLAPLAVVPGAVALLSQAPGPIASWRGWRWRDAFLFCAAASVGLALLLWCQSVLYGGPFAPSYADWRTLFSADYIAANVRNYPALLAQTHTWLPLAGLALLPLALARRGTAMSDEGRAIVVSASAVLLLNVALYLPYTPYSHWPFLRFLLPGLTALFVLFGSGVALVTRALWREKRARDVGRGFSPAAPMPHAKWAAIVVPLVALVVIAQARPLTEYALHDWRAQTRVRLMGHYLREALPANAAVLSFLHSGALAFYTQREIVRLDALVPDTLDRVVDDLQRYGYQPVFVIDQEMEEEAFRARFPGSRFGPLDWPPRAVFTSIATIKYFDAADRDRHRQGIGWATDVVR